MWGHLNINFFLKWWKLRLSLWRLCKKLILSFLSSDPWTQWPRPQEHPPGPLQCPPEPHWMSQEAGPPQDKSPYRQTLRLVKSPYPQSERLVKSPYPQTQRLVKSPYPQTQRLVKSPYPQTQRLVKTRVHILKHRGGFLEVSQEKSPYPQTRVGFTGLSRYESISSHT